MRDSLSPLIFELIAERGWGALTLTSIATQAQVSLETLHQVATSKEEIFGLLIDFIEEKSILKESDVAGLTPEEKSFEVLMRRFEVAQPYRPGIARLFQDLKTSPCDLQPLMPQVVGALERLTSEAGFQFDGFLGPVQVRLFGLIYAHLFQEWLNDETADLGKTMAKTDHALKRYVPCLLDPMKVLEVF